MYIVRKYHRYCLNFMISSISFAVFQLPRATPKARVAEAVAAQDAMEDVDARRMPPPPTPSSTPNERKALSTYRSDLYRTVRYQFLH